MKMKATKLFAVVALATSPACERAEPTPTRSGAEPVRISAAEPVIDPWSSHSSIDSERVHRSLAGLDRTLELLAHPRVELVRPVEPIAHPAIAITARPRQMPSGAPACGNVASRAPRSVECETAGSETISTPTSVSGDKP